MSSTCVLDEPLKHISIDSNGVSTGHVILTLPWIRSCVLNVSCCERTETSIVGMGSRIQLRSLMCDIEQSSKVLDYEIFTILNEDCELVVNVQDGL